MTEQLGQGLIVRLCREVLAADPGRYFKPDQYNNEANPLAHYETTGADRAHEGGIRYSSLSSISCAASASSAQHFSHEHGNGRRRGAAGSQQRRGWHGPKHSKRRA